MTKIFPPISIVFCFEDFFSNLKIIRLHSCFSSHSFIHSFILPWRMWDNAVAFPTATCNHLNISSQSTSLASKKKKSWWEGSYVKYQASTRPCSLPNKALSYFTISPWHLNDTRHLDGSSERQQAPEACMGTSTGWILRHHPLTQ